MFGNEKITPEFFGALGQGLLNGGTNTWQALGTGLNAGTAQLSASNKEAKQLKFVEQFAPTFADAVKAGVMSPSDAYAAAITKPKTEFKQLDDGTYGSWDGNNFTPLGKAQKPATPQFQKFDDGSYGWVNPQTQQVNIAGKVEKPKELPGIGKEYEYAKENGFNGTFNDYVLMKRGNGLEVITNPDGTTTVRQGGATKSLTESQGKNAGFLIRAEQSQNVLNNLEDEGTSIVNKAAQGVPVAGNYVMSPEAQKYTQAKRDFINAVLRKESGAVISDQEFANAEQQYFPQPGDGPDVIAQKRKNREAAIEGFRIGAGPGATPPGQSGVKSYKDYFEGP